MIKLRWYPFLRYPWISFAACLLFLIPCWLKLTDFSVSSESGVLLEQDQRNNATFEKVMDILEKNTVVVVNMELEDVFTPDGIQDIFLVSEAFFKQPGMLDVKSLTHSYKPVRAGFTFKMELLVKPRTRDFAELERLRAFSLENPLIRNVMISPDCRNTVLTVTYDRDLSSPEQRQVFHDEIREILAPFQKKGLRFHVVGLPLVENEIRNTMLSDVKWFIPVSLVLMIVLLAIGLKSIGLILYTFANQVFVMAMIPGLIQLAGYELNVFTIMLFPLWAAIQLALLTHLTTAYQNTRDENASDPVENTLRKVFRSCLFASLTTAVGLLSLGISDVKQVREFGILGSAGIVLIFLFTFGPGISLLKIFSLKKQITGHTPGFKFVSLSNLSEPFLLMINRRRVPIWIASFALLLLIVVGLGHLRTDVRAVEFLSPESETRQAVDMFDQRYGGINILQIHIDTGRVNGVSEISFLNYLEDIQRYAESKPEVSGVYSYALLMAMMNQVWEQEKPGSLKVPQSQILLGIFNIALQSQNFPFLRALCDEDFQTAYLIVRTPDMPSREYLDVVNDIVEYAKRTKPEHATVNAREGLHSLLEADRRILESQVQTAGITVLVIGLVLAILWKSWLLSMIALLINLLPVALVVAAAGLADIPLNSITIMVAAIAFGIAVDDAVHFITQWNEECRNAPNSKTALIQTLQIKGRPIIYTSLILMGIFGMFFKSSFPPVAHFGILSCLAFAGALVSVLFLLPTLLSRVSHKSSSASSISSSDEA